MVKKEAFADVLNQYMKQADMRSYRLCKKIDTLTQPETNVLSRSTLDNWCFGVSKSPQNPWQIIAIGLALELSVSQLDGLLLRANLPNLSQMAHRADQPAWLARYSHLFDPSPEEPPPLQGELSPEPRSAPSMPEEIISSWSLGGRWGSSFINNWLWRRTTVMSLFLCLCVVAGLLIQRLLLSDGHLTNDPVEVREWFMQLLRADDYGLIFINSQLVAYTKEKVAYAWQTETETLAEYNVSHNNQRSPWLNLTPYLTNDLRPDYLTFIHLNGPSSGKGEIRLKYRADSNFPERIMFHDVPVFSVNLRAVRLSSTGKFLSLKPPFTGSQTDVWQVELNSFNGFAALFVNGLPAWATYFSSQGTFAGGDISPFFDPINPNAIVIQGWQTGSDFNVKLTLCKNGQLMYHVQGTADEEVRYGNLIQPDFEEVFWAESLTSQGKCPFDVPIRYTDRVDHF